ncbi:hypothetical protein SAMN05446037_102639 [Anaerovirgula multivorans]|uniref:Uncharacterized protein n=1 Tax=Anaerovirgula multivorans TaxID=312168 RepID=A0A239I9F4_9FIRM|nr:hypothetical protein [Anaerovirgula multivorans]SNS90022.1 hypothetical protein SAMN05446037_102639 [Anaerovirgula multivorans]
MDKYKFGEWIIEFDRVKTEEYYKNICEGCTCAYCINYRENLKSLTNDIEEFFSKLGIDPLKEGEFIEFGEIEPGIRHYSGFYHFVGNIIDGPKFSSLHWDKEKMLKVGSYFLGFSDEIELLPNDFPKPVVQLEFEVSLPWIIEEKPK